MSWVLILNSDYTAKPPAVIGGYPTREAAEAAGDAATAFVSAPPYDLPYYTHYLVMPGAAVDAGGSTHSDLVRDCTDYANIKIERRTRRFP